MTNLALNLTTSVERHPERVALRLDERAIDYAALEELVADTAGLLRGKGVVEGDRVAVMLPNVPEFAVLFFAVLRLGAVVVPMNPLFKAREIEYYLTDSGAKLLFAWPAVAEAATTGCDAAGAELILIDPEQGLPTSGRPVRETVEVSPETTAVILYTSGTTGQPKGAQLSHANLQSNQEVSARTLLELTPDQTIIGCLPLFHVFGLTVALNTAIAAGACISLIPRFDAGKVLDIIERDRVSIFIGVPTMYAGLLHHPSAAERDLSSLRLCISGGAALPVELLRGFEARFGCTILEGYGLSETSPVACFNHPHAVRKPGSIGTPIEGVEQRLVTDEGVVLQPGADEVGEIQIRGDNVMTGYWQRPDATATAIDADGWFRSGDMARTDADGYYFIVDRKNDLIIRGGYNVYPREVEEVLYEHPAVAEAAVIGLPHDTLGEEIGAAVSLKPGQSATEAELIEFVRERLAAYKYPRHVWLLDSLPKTATGKILRREVRTDAT